MSIVLAAGIALMLSGWLILADYRGKRGQVARDKVTFTGELSEIMGEE